MLMSLQAYPDDKVSQLEKRKQVVVMTLAYVQQVVAEVEKNTEWMDIRTQKRRYTLLADLCSSYEVELTHIVKKLDGVTIRGL
jgi:hypothetical protein